MVPTSWQDEALARDGVSRDMDGQCVLRDSLGRKGETEEGLLILLFLFSQRIKIYWVLTLQVILER